MPLLRAATAGDLEGIFAIADDAVLHSTATMETEPRPASERLDWLRAHDRAAYPVLVVTCEDEPGRVAGWGCLSPWSPRPGYAPTCEDTVYVAADRRGRGLGRLLLAELVAHARRTGRRWVIARISGDNAASLRLHESLGFRTLGVMPRCGSKLGRLVDVHVLGCELLPVPEPGPSTGEALPPDPAG